MTTTMPTLRPRLLAGSVDGSVDLESHEARHGPLPVPDRVENRWSREVVAVVEASGLTGRGGAGFPVAAKWSSIRRSGGRPTVVVNAVEGEPASAKDRVLLERSPHLVLDGALVAAAALRASDVVVCVVDDASAFSMRRAIDERRRTGRLPTRCRIEQIGSRYLAGEESALASALDGRGGLPSFRVDKSVPLRVRGRQVLVHNAETLAQVALVARHGAEWFRRAGTVDAPGTTLVTVSGAVRVPGVVEVELGTPLVGILAAAEPAEPVGAVLPGGYGGAWLSASELTVPYAEGPLREAGAPIGPGVIVAVGASSCGVAETARLVRFLADESAGQCGPCIFGLAALAEDLERLGAGSGGHEALERVALRTGAIDGRGGCRHPDGAVRLVRSALRVFADDLDAHAAGRPCERHRNPTVLRFPVARRTGGRR